MRNELCRADFVIKTSTYEHSMVVSLGEGAINHGLYRSAGSKQLMWQLS